MEQLAKIGQTLPSTKEIGNIVINYSDYDKPIDAIPIELGDGRTYLLTNIRPTFSDSRLILQDLNGNIIKELMNFGNEFCEVTVDNDNIYVFTSNSENPMFYIINKKNLELRYKKPLGKSRIQSVCCNEKELFTFDSDNAEVQKRDKEGNILSTINTTKKSKNSSSVEITKVYSTSEGFHFATVGEFGINNRFRRECEEKFGKEFMDLNRDMKNIAFDESSQTIFMAARNIICVSNQYEIKGIMYFPDKSIKRISVDSNTNSLIISSNNWPETGKCCSLDNGGSLEILPISMVLERIKSSEAFLIARNQNKQLMDLCHKIVDESNGDIDQMILLLQELNNKRTSSDSDLSTIEDKNMSDSYHPNRHSK